MKRIGILVVAYNAASTLEAVLNRIPADFRPRIERVLLSDDASHVTAQGLAIDGGLLGTLVIEQ